MSALTHPQGPEPESTYWGRRAFVLIGLVLTIALVWWLLSLIGADENGPSTAVPSPGGSTSATTGSPSGTPTTEPATSATPTPGTTASSPTASVTPTPTGPVECDPAAVALKVTGMSPVTAGKVTKFDVSFTNTAAYACDLNLVKNPMELRIFSGTDRIWSTNDCAAWGLAGVHSVKQGEAWKGSIAWPGRRSKATCELRTEALKPGTYVATLLLSGNQRPSQFVMQVKA
ncbi:MAG TPA: hypothetical protein VLR88_09460 [Propionibacteriaceae bacterium]|nr:hypothetical protein [Propionibacteriaceae bacterium]